MSTRGGSLSDLQLLGINLPSMFDSSLTETERIRQRIKQVDFDLADAVVRAQNKRRRMFEEARVVTNEKNAQATVEKN